MKPYELLDHTADAKFRAYGLSLEHAFANAVKALTAIATDPEKMEKKDKFPIVLQAKDPKRLLFDMIDQIIFLVDTEGFLPAGSEDLTVEKKKGIYTLSGILVGDDAKKYGCNLKAATYSDMLVEQDKEGKWVLQAVVDI
ncbi:archease [Candidatus Woesearchaeota archaeon]|nr:archease [Candidatus Woesearchaeota archaeon]